MKAIVCELCGSNDIVKQGEFYICQHCGTKYSLEEAKKLLGTVRIDNSPKLANYYKLARQAKENDDAETAAKYYDLILQEDPESWEAHFYNVYYRAAQTRIINIQTAANSVKNSLNTVFELIKNNNDGIEIKKQQASEVALRVTIICALFENAARKHLTESFNNSWPNASPNILMGYATTYADRAFAEMDALFTCGDLVERYYAPDKGMIIIACKLWKSGIDIWKNIYSLYDNHTTRYTTMRNTYVAKVRKYETDYVFSAPDYAGFPSPLVNHLLRKNSNSDFGFAQSSSSSSTSGGCYVATTVYGSYDCPQVWTLRRFRDYTLAESWYGRAFIHTYYAISPTLVKWFGGAEWFRNMWKPSLDRMVEHLNNQGVADTPYTDRTW